MLYNTSSLLRRFCTTAAKVPIEKTTQGPKNVAKVIQFIGKPNIAIEAVPNEGPASTEGVKPEYTQLNPAKRGDHLQVLPDSAVLKKTDFRVSDGGIGVIEHIPEHLLSRPVRIYQRPKNQCKSGTDRPEHWRIDLDTQPRWTNSLMGYVFRSDPYTEQGVRTLLFDSIEDAQEFCRAKGFTNCFVEEPPFQKNTHGERTYAENFLSYHVRRRRANTPKDKFAANQFKHTGRGKSSWVNLKHTAYGQKESKQVSQTQWKDEQPNYHTTDQWRTSTFAKRQDLARVLGK